MKTVLLVTDVNFWEKSSGHRVRISALIGYLARQVILTVVNTGPAPQNIETILSAQYEAEFVVLEKTKYLNSNGYGRRLKAFLKGRHFDCIIIEYIHSSYFLNFLVEDITVILDAHDIISDRADEFKKYNYAGALYELSAETETEIFKVYDHILVLCQADQDKIDAMIGPGKALLCPHPAKCFRHPLKKHVKNIAFIASAYLPNVDAINWFVNYCWPQISEKHDIQLCIYGTVCGNIKLHNQQQIVCKGFAADINQMYKETDIVINPVRFGAGLKIKNVEALAHGRPLVTTSHGARGIETSGNDTYLVADTADEFVEAIEFLISNIGLRNKLSKNSLEYVERNFSLEKCFGKLLESITHT
jgi:glycosyltransferase involved in cell wall biosynthesis